MAKKSRNRMMMFMWTPNKKNSHGYSQPFLNYLPDPNYLSSNKELIIQVD